MEAIAKAAGLDIFQVIACIAACESYLLTVDPLRALRQAGFVYFAVNHSERGVIKIGFTEDVPRRERQLQAATNSSRKSRVTMVASVAVVRRGIETDLHRHFGANRVHGEWFRETPELSALVEAVRAGERPLLLGPEPRETVEPNIKYPPDVLFADSPIRQAYITDYKHSPFTVFEAERLGEILEVAAQVLERVGEHERARLPRKIASAQIASARSAELSDEWVRSPMIINRRQRELLQIAWTLLGGAYELIDAGPDEAHFLACFAVSVLCDAWYTADDFRADYIVAREEMKRGM